MHLKEGEQHVDDVSSALKRFLRDLPDGLFTRAQRLAWLEASGGSAACIQPCLPYVMMSHHALDRTGPSSSAYSASLPLITLQRWRAEMSQSLLDAWECYHHHEKQSCWEGALGTSF